MTSKSSDRVSAFCGLQNLTELYCLLTTTKIFGPLQPCITRLDSEISQILNISTPIHGTMLFKALQSKSLTKQVDIDLAKVTSGTSNLQTGIFPTPLYGKWPIGDMHCIVFVKKDVSSSAKIARKPSIMRVSPSYIRKIATQGQGRFTRHQT